MHGEELVYTHIFMKVYNEIMNFQQYEYDDDYDDNEDYEEDGEGEDEQEQELNEENESLQDSLRNDLANTTFEELLGMKDKLGTKVYKQTVLKKFANVSQQIVKNKTPIDGDGDDDNDCSDDVVQQNNDSLQLKKKKNSSKLNINHQYKRPNRSHPIEASNKKVDYRYNFAHIPSIQSARKKSKSIKKGSVESNSESIRSSGSAPQFRDPRFEPRCGVYDERRFTSNYRFITDIRQQELDQLKKQLRRAKTVETKEKFKFAIQRLMNQIRSDQEKHYRKELVTKVVKAKEQTLRPMPHPSRPPPPPPPPPSSSSSSISTSNLLQNVDSSNAKRKVFVNKTTIKRAQLVEKYRQLKQSGKLDKYLEKKRKKNVAKDRKILNRNVKHPLI